MKVKTVVAVVVSVLMFSGCSSSSSLELLEEVGVRGSEVLVPEGWVYESVDGGGSGSWSYWNNPNSPIGFLEQVGVITGASFGTWLGLDGVEGSVDPTFNLYSDYGPFLEIEKVNDRTFYFDLDMLYGVMSGVWVASLGKDGYCCVAYTQAWIQLIEPSEKIVKEFRDYVVSDIS